ncbi:MAG: hypothetical protein MI725_09760, partial [Pirellulales bacterium]|nr:hypothetical protein [Pirellulales bacterium]
MINITRRHGAIALAVVLTLTVVHADNASAAFPDYIWQNTGTGDWAGTGVNYNWDDPLNLATDPLPSGPDGEGAIIDNGGTAQVTTAIDNTGTNGPGYATVNGDSTLQITSTGSLSVLESSSFVASTGLLQIGQDSSAGTLIVESGGSVTATRLSLFQPNSLIDLDGTASLTVNGPSAGATAMDANIGRRLRITGPNVTFNTSSLQIGDNATLIPEITNATTHSTIQVTNGASLDGAVQVEFNGVTPSFGNTWNLIEAATVTGAFDSVTAPGVSLGPGQVFSVKQVPNGATTLVQLGIEQQIYLEVNRDTGAVAIKKSDSTPIAIQGYTIGSEVGSLNSANGVWNSLFDNSVAGWVEANPSSNRLSEVNI